jgi:peptidoglycan/xylan/chitin deacetylase (PgdA/CDA1 family)
MKRMLIPTSMLIASLSVAFFLYGRSSQISREKQMSWRHKEREIKSRLLAVPILLYHNIDGRGVFSVTGETLRSHFRLIRERGIKVIPLRELVNRLENPAPFDEKVVVITFDDGFPSMYSALLPMVREFRYPVTLFVYTDFIHNSGKRSLTWKQLKEMDSGWIDVQCHTISHQDLTAQGRDGYERGRRRLFNEIYLSKRMMELYLDKKIDYFAFPYGRYNLNIVNLCDVAGYKRVFSTDSGSNFITRDNFCLRRQHIKKSYSLALLENMIQKIR